MVYDWPRAAITSKRAKMEWNAELSSRNSSDGVFPEEKKSLGWYAIVAIVLAAIIIIAWCFSNR